MLDLIKKLCQKNLVFAQIFQNWFVNECARKNLTNITQSYSFLSNVEEPPFLKKEVKKFDFIQFWSLSYKLKESLFFIF